MDTFQVSENIKLKTPQPLDAEELYALVDRNRSYLRRWLPWLDWNQSVASSEAFINSPANMYRYAILFKDTIVGIIGFNDFNPTNRTTDIGYWISEEFAGKGITTACLKKVIEIGFEHYNLKRIGIRANPNNDASNRVIEKVGFVFEGVCRNGENLYGEQSDLNIYSLIDSDHKREPSKN